MAAQLPKVTKPVLNAGEAHAILSWVFGNVSVKPANLSEKDQCFAQAMLMEMLNKSFAMGFVEALLRAAAKIPAGPMKVITTFLKGAGKNLVTYKDKDDLKKMTEDPKIYKSILETLARNFKSAWKLRETTGEPVYT
jgi:hypothetical protein